MGLLETLKNKVLSVKSFEKNELADMGPGEIPKEKKKNGK